jgi:hypothetical protein
LWISVYALGERIEGRVVSSERQKIRKEKREMRKESAERRKEK